MSARVLILGSGMVAEPVFAYLERYGAQLTIACNNPEQAATLAPNAAVEAWQFPDPKRLEQLIQSADVVVSLLPATMHLRAAELCIAHRRHLVTASYVSDEMAALDAQAKAAGTLLLNEVGLDPGLDHMSAMVMIDRVAQDGGVVSAFHSTCGGLPAPDANDNPWGYKFSWNPLGVLRALNNSATFLEQGKKQTIGSADLLEHHEQFHFDGIGALESYPNRDATKYIELYGLNQVQSIFRGTLRYPGWCSTLQTVRALGLLEDAPVRAARWNDELAGALRLPAGLSAEVLRDELEGQLPAEPAVLDRLQWLGLFGDALIPVEHSRLEALAAQMATRMGYGQGERDMVVMRHQLTVATDHKSAQRVSHLICYGQPDGDSAMARTVGLPVAIATRLVLEGKVDQRGVVIPTCKTLYTPILAELQQHGITFVETDEG